MSTVLTPVKEVTVDSLQEVTPQNVPNSKSTRIMNDPEVVEVEMAEFAATHSDIPPPKAPEMPQQTAKQEMQAAEMGPYASQQLPTGAPSQVGSAVPGNMWFGGVTTPGGTAAFASDFVTHADSDMGLSAS